MSNRLLRIVFNSDLRSGHNGLTAVAKKLDLDMSTLKPGEFVAFVNMKKTMLKIYAAGQVIVHCKPPKGQLNLNTLKLIPKYFNGGEFEYTKALSEIIKRELK